MKNIFKTTKRITVFILFVFIFSDLKAEDLDLNTEVNDNVPAAGTTVKKWFIGGNVGATFGDLNQISISPLVGYQFSPEFSSGLQFIYNYSWQTVNEGQSNQSSINSSTFGGNVFFQYNPISEFYLKTEFEYDSYSNFQTTQNTTINQAVPFLFLGAGYSKKISKIATINAGIKFDLLNNINSPYQSGTPFFYVGTGIGI
ncbi:MAG TPA: hypothetical protein PKA90_02040 [Ignavibacteria bacterium]|mgnify:CR=1 FL=1|nr:hypothetical protein [Ignavibacteria bacterium]HMR39188.1 hypothetical protein [Ignavibacteria bacterium]